MTPKKKRRTKRATTKQPAAKKSPSSVFARTPTKGKRGLRVNQARYDAMRRALLASIPRSNAGVAFVDLPDLVRPRLPADWTGSVKWHVTTVKLDMETRGEIERVPGATPQRLRRR